MRKAMVCLILLGTFSLSNPAADSLFAEDGIPIFNRDESYDIYYEVSDFEVDVAENVRIHGTVVIEGTVFLVIKGAEIYGSKQGYILLSSVKAILPNSLRPRRTFDTARERQARY